MKKVLIEKKKNSGPNTEFKIQNYIQNNDNKWVFSGSSYIRLEFDIIKDIKADKKECSDIYSTFSKNKDNKNIFTNVCISSRNNQEYLKSKNNYTTFDNIDKLNEYE